MRRMLRRELYKLRCSWWFFPLLLFVVLLLTLMLGFGQIPFRTFAARVQEAAPTGVEGRTQEALQIQYTRLLAAAALGDGRPALLSGLVVSVWFFGLERLGRGFCGPMYAGVPRTAQTVTRTLLACGFGAFAALAALLLHLRRFLPDWSLLPAGLLCRWLPGYLLAAAAAVSMNVLAASIPRDFFTSTACSAAVSGFGLLLAREQEEVSLLKTVFCWYPCLLQRNLPGAGLWVLLAFVGIAALEFPVILFVFQRREIR